MPQKGGEVDKMENQKTMMKYHQINVTLDNGVEVILKVKGKDYYECHNWLATLPGVQNYEDVRAVLPIRPHTTLKNPSKITQARMAAGLTQQEFADLLGVSLTQAQRWEYGYNRTKAETLKRIGEVLNIDWTTLVGE